MHISDLGLSPAAHACLRAAGLTDVEELTSHTANELLDRYHVPATELYEIICRLNQHQLSLPSTPNGIIRLTSPRNREMLRLRLIEKLSLTAIGKRTGVSQERVRQLLHVYYGLDGKRRG
jgi:hypothetical protein